MTIDLNAVANQIAQKAQALKTQYPTERQLLAFLGTSTSDPPDVRYS